MKHSPSAVDALLADHAFARRLAAAVAGADAADLVQDAYVAALRRPPAPDVSTRGWLTLVLRRRARDVARERGRRERRELAAGVAAPVPTPAELTSRAEAHGRLVTALNALDEPDRELLLMRFFQERTTEAIGTSLGIPAASVRRRTTEALRRLRTELEGQHGGRESLLPLVAPPTLVRTTMAAKLASAAAAMTALAIVVGYRGCKPAPVARAPVGGGGAAGQVAGRRSETTASSGASAPDELATTTPPRFAQNEDPAPPQATGVVETQGIRDGVRAAMPVIHACYEAALARDPQLGGRLVASFRLGKRGNVGRIVSATFAPQDDREREPRDPLLQQCVLTALARSEFPAPEGGDVDVTFPFVFSADADGGTR